MVLNISTGGNFGQYNALYGNAIHKYSTLHLTKLNCTAWKLLRGKVGQLAERRQGPLFSSAIILPSVFHRISWEEGFIINFSQ